MLLGMCLALPFFVWLLLMNQAASGLVLALQMATSTKATHYQQPQFNGQLQQQNSADMKGKLLLAQVLYRHGDRMPIEPYPTDPYINPDLWPAGWGQLTNLGKQQHYELGKWLRKRYRNLIRSTYNKDEIYIRSTDVDRTLMSALSNLAGLYEPEGSDVWNKNVDWQPIPVHTVPEKYDETLAGKAACPAYEYSLSALLNSPEFEKYNARFKYLYDYLSKYTGRAVDSLEAVQRINNTLFIEQLYNKTLPDWTKEVYPSADMSWISDFTFAVATYTRQMARLKMGPLVKEIFERFEQKYKNQLEPNRLLWIYSAHDTTVASLLNALNLFDIHSPPYTACILMEMRVDEKNRPFISIFYKNTTAEPLPINIPKCGLACPLSKLMSIYEEVMPKDWAEECKLSTMMMTYEDANLGMAMGILVAIISAMLLVSYITLIYYRRRAYKPYSYIPVA